MSQRELGPFFQLVIGWGLGSVAALAAAFVSLGIAVSAVRDRSARKDAQPGF
jgi:hypothetical protein